MMLAQACGRLIRTATDRGVVAVLDRRLGTARYRWDIVRALPPMRRTRHRAEAEAFLRALVPRGSCRLSTVASAMDPKPDPTVPDQVVGHDADQVVRLRVDAGIATITLDSQPNRNALSRQLVAELGERLDEIESTARRPRHRADATPARRSAPAPTSRSVPTRTARLVGRWSAVLERLMDAEQPTIAAVDGAVRGRWHRADGVVRPRRRASGRDVRPHRGADRRGAGDHLGADPAAGRTEPDRRGDAHRRAVRRRRGALDRPRHPRHRRRRGRRRPSCARGSSPARRGPWPRPSGCCTACPDSTGRRRSTRCGPSPTSCSAVPTRPRAWRRSARSAHPHGT